MKRTKYYDRTNVLSLRIERKRRRLWRRKAERDQAAQAKLRSEALDNQGYLIGLLIPRNVPWLTKADRDFLDRLHAIEPGQDGATYADKEKLLKLITLLMPAPDAVITYSVNPDGVDDGGTGIAYAYAKRRRVA